MEEEISIQIEFLDIRLQAKNFKMNWKKDPKL